MGIVKWYEISCDNCDRAINHINYYPSYADLKEEGCVLSKDKIFCCEECKKDFFKNFVLG